MEAAPVLVESHPPADQAPGPVEPTDAQYGEAIIRGLVIGWVAVPVVVGFLAFLGAPDAGFAFWAGTGLAVGFWCGLFLGGVFSLSVFQLRQEVAAAAPVAAGASPAAVGGRVGQPSSAELADVA